MEYYSPTRRNKIAPFAETWIDLEIVIKIEISQKEKNKYHNNIAYTWNLEKWYKRTNLKAGTETQVERTNLRTPRGNNGVG